MALSRRTLLLGALALCLSGTAVFIANKQGIFSGGNLSGNLAIASSDGTSSTAMQTEFDYVTGDQVLGQADAPIEIIEYASLTCPHCANFHVETFPELKKEYIDTGKAKYILREVYFDRFGLWSAIVARCGAQNQYYPFIDLLMKSQKRWLSEEDPVAAIREIGRMGGLSQQRIEACLQDETFAKTLLEAYQSQSEQDQVRSTPTFIINGEKYAGDQSIEELRNILDPILNK